MKNTISRGFKPLCTRNNVMIAYCSGKLWQISQGNTEEKCVLFPGSWKDASRLAVRLFRREPRCAVALPEGRVLVAAQRKLILADLEQGLCQTVFSSREGFSDVLSLCLSREEGYLAYWGDYGGNARREEVRLYGLTVQGCVQTLFAFPAGAVRHVHSILPALDGGYWIFTGDTEEAAGIYRADSAFAQITPVAVGQQRCRAVVGFDTPKGLLYATDAVNEPNYLYLRTQDGTLHQLAPLNGSCIYGAAYSDGWLFSTTVEPDENNRGLLSWISPKRGAGILSREACLVAVNRELQVQTLLKMKKDILPMKLFQYGCIQFSTGDGEPWLYPVAVSRKDGKPIRLSGPGGKL